MVELVMVDVRRRRTLRDGVSDRVLGIGLVLVAAGPELGTGEGVHGRVVEESAPTSGFFGEVDEGVRQGPSADLVHEWQRRIN